MKPEDLILKAVTYTCIIRKDDQDQKGRDQEGCHLNIYFIVH